MPIGDLRAWTSKRDEVLFNWASNDNGFRSGMARPERGLRGWPEYWARTPILPFQRGMSCSNAFVKENRVWNALLSLPFDNRTLPAVSRGGTCTPSNKHRMNANRSGYLCLSGRRHVGPMFQDTGSLREFARGQLYRDQPVSRSGNLIPSRFQSRSSQVG